MEPRVCETNRWTDEQVAAALQAAKTKLERGRQKLHEPLAVVGIGCRFPAPPIRKTTGACWKKATARLA